MVYPAWSINQKDLSEWAWSINQEDLVRYLNLERKVDPLVQFPWVGLYQAKGLSLPKSVSVGFHLLSFGWF